MKNLQKKIQIIAQVSLVLILFGFFGKKNKSDSSDDSKKEAVKISCEIVEV